jgi:hypothetical protein
VDDRHRGQVAVDLAQRRRARCFATRDEELNTRRFEWVRPTRQARLDDRRRGQLGDIEDRARPIVVGHRLAQHVVCQPGHHAYGRIGSPCQQSDFEIDGVVVTGADHRERVSDVGAVQIVGD